MKRRLPNLLTAAALVLAAYVLCPAAILAMRANLLAGAAGAVALLAAALLYRSLADRREAARWHRLINGLCVHCGYDLTGNESGVCPECGGRPGDRKC